MARSLANSLSADPALPVEALRGVGPSLAEKLQRLGIFRIGDLLLHLPIRYEDRSRVVPLREVRAQEGALVQGKVTASRIAYGRRRSWLVIIEDDTGALGVRFFHFSKAQQNALKVGDYLRCFGEPRFSSSGLELIHPEYQVFRSEPEPPAPALTPVYPTTKGLGQARVRNLVAQLLDLPWSDAPGGPYQTLIYLHRPPPEASTEDIRSAQERIALDELTAYYLVMKLRQRARATVSARSMHASRTARRHRTPPTPRALPPARENGNRAR